MKRMIKLFTEDDNSVCIAIYSALSSKNEKDVNKDRNKQNDLMQLTVSIIVSELSNNDEDSVLFDSETDGSGDMWEHKLALPCMSIQVFVRKIPFTFHCRYPNT